MALPWLLEEVSKDAPCGPDLERADDPAFIDYYFEAEGRLPDRYFTPGTRSEANPEGSLDVLFDPRSVDRKTERDAIEALLKRSRDVRLLSLLARWEALAGRSAGFAQAIAGIADLLEANPDDVHPNITPTPSDRRGALEELGSSVTVIFPLQHMPLNGQVDVTLRRYMVGSGKTAARSYEEDANASQLVSALQDNGGKAALDQTHSDLTMAADGLGRIARACKAHPEKPFNLDFSNVLDTISAMQDVIQQARPDLDVWSSDALDDVTQDDDAPETAQTGDAPVASATSVAQVDAADAVTDQPAARVTLQAIEKYLAHNEPSSAALLLVTQARLLIGRPLIEALETLLPGEAGKAVIDFGPAHGFSLPMERLRSLAAENAQSASPEAELAAPTAPDLKTRADVAAHIRSVENFYRKNEPTSPIPLLLVRARSYLDKDFEAIVAELLPAPKQSGD
ncbi:MAG: type VI secretion system ImpA family N-terminal domain-containing protein [Aliishimia sp.]